VGNGNETAGDVRLTGFVEFENQNKQSFQCEDIGDKFFQCEWTWWIYTVLAVCVCMYACAVGETKRSGTLSVCYLFQKEFKQKNELKLLLFLVNGIQCLSCGSVSVMLRRLGWKLLAFAAQNT
jgi:hypothetical protein